MKNKFKHLVIIPFMAVLYALVMTVSFTACGGDDDVENSSPIIGTWYMDNDHYVAGNNEYTSHTEMTYKKDGTVSFIEKEIHYETGTPEESSWTDEGRYEINGNILTIIWDSDEIFETTFSIKGNKMTTREGVWTKK